MKLTYWIEAFRPRTLPLALSCCIMGNLLALAHGFFHGVIFLLTILTAVSLQILSNLANDYGDTVHGVDNGNRIGPKRVTQSGAISRGTIKIAIVVFTGIALFSCLLLIFAGALSTGECLFFSLLGIAAAGAAITYTVGKKPYGYIGLGDLMVFLFFGLTGVVGTYYLQTKHLDFSVLLPASSVGFLCTGVLNLNNMRDVENDSKTGKKTLVVRMGIQNAKIYHTFLIAVAILFSGLYMVMQYHIWYQFLYLITVPIFCSNVLTVLRNYEPMQLNSELKKLSLSTSVFSTLFGLCLLL